MKPGSFFTFSSFLKKKSFSHFSITIFVMTFGEGLINIFVPVYLLILGFEIYKILIFYFLVSLYFIIFSYAGVKVVSRVGEKHAILLSSPFLILYYLGLNHIELNSYLFYVLPAFLAIRMVLFNYGYHLVFLNSSSKNKRGKEIATLGMISLFALSLAPYFGSLFATLNFTLLFSISSTLIVLGAVPLLLTKDRFEKIDFSFLELISKIRCSKGRRNLISFSGYAVESIVDRTVWPLFLIIIIGSVKDMGSIVSMSMIFSVIVFYFAGKMTDKFERKKLIKVTNIIYFLAWVLRLLATSFYRVLIVDSFKKATETVLHVSWNAHSYDLAQRKSCYEFIVAREIIFNAARVVFLPLMAIIFFIDFYPFTIAFLTASISSLSYMVIDK